MSRRSVLAARIAEQGQSIPVPPPPPVVLIKPLPRGACHKCGVMYAPRAMRAHLQHCTGKQEWPGDGPKPVVFINDGQPVNESPVIAFPKQDPVALQQAKQHIAQAVEKAAGETKNACPGCGLIVPRGLHLHTRACKALKKA